MKGGISMGSTVLSSAEATINLRLDAELKSEFLTIAEKESRPASEILRELMRNYIREARRQEYFQEAERESKIIAESEDEAEVMRWIENVSEYGELK
jgi:hypothetical protein